MRFIEIPRDPDDGLRLHAGKVGENLAQVPVVGSLQLVLDENAAPIGRVAGDDIGRKLLDGDFRAFRFQRNPNRLGQPLHVCGQPGREVLRFVSPHVAQGHVLQLSKLERRLLTSRHRGLHRRGASIAGVHDFLVGSPSGPQTDRLGPLGALLTAPTAQIATAQRHSGTT